MAALDHLTSQCDEILMLIFFSLDGRSVLRLAQTCRKLYKICTYDQQLWSRMCLMDFTISLVSPHPFACFRHLYKCIYQSREILRFYLSDAYQDCGNNRYGVFPSWLWTWVVFNTNPPLLPEWIRNYHEPFLRYKLGEISLGKTLRVWCLKSSDLPEHIVTRVEYGTSYYRWRDIQVAAMRAHGGARGLERFMLKRCWRARGYVERAFDRIQNGTYTIHNQNKCGGESSEQLGEDLHSMQVAQIFAQIANASRQVANGSGVVFDASRNVGRDPGQIAHGSVSIAHGSVQNAPGSVQILHGLVRVAQPFRQVAHGSSQHANNSVSLAHVSHQMAYGSSGHTSGLNEHGSGGHTSGLNEHGSGGPTSGLNVYVSGGPTSGLNVHGSGGPTSGLNVHGSGQPVHGSSHNGQRSAEIGESSRESTRSARYVFSSSSNSSIESE